MSKPAPRLALVTIGYQEFTMPVPAAMALIESAQKVEWRYQSDSRVYWVAPDQPDLSLKLIEASAILAAKPAAVIEAERAATARWEAERAARDLEKQQEAALRAAEADERTTF